MNILNKLTIKSLVMNKKRTIVTIIAIILSCSLISGVVTLVKSFQTAIVNQTKQTSGNYHLKFLNLDNTSLNYIKNNINVSNYYVEKEIGYSMLKGSKNDYKPYLHIKEYDKSGFENSSIKLISGNFPKDSSEVLISEHILSNAEVKLKIGDELNLDIIKRYSLDDTGKEYELSQKNSYVNPKDNEKSLEKLNEEYVKKIGNKKYKIVGIIERPNDEPRTSPGYTIISKLDKSSTGGNVFVLLKDPKKYRDFISNLEESNIIKKMDKNTENANLNSVYQVNTNLLRFEGVNEENSVNNALYTVSGIIIIIILFSSILVIRNSFSISVTERTKQYGMLASIGATRKTNKEKCTL